MISQIACMARNRVIGSEGGLPWDLPEDMQFFRDTTRGHAIIMGRKTFESMPGRLKNRLNVIVTRNDDYKVDGCEVFNKIEDAIEFCKTKKEEWGEEIFVIGGEEIYRQTLPHTDRIYLTVIDQDFEGDAHFPEYGDEFKEISRRDRNDPFEFSFLVLDRK